MDVYNTAIIIASALGEEEAAYKYLASLKKRIQHILDTLRAHSMPLKRVMLMEWIEPVYNCGHWIPYQIAQAGGIDMLGNPSGYSIVTAWDKIVKYNPEVLIIAPCGFHIQRASQELHILSRKKEWHQLRAVQNKQVYLLDFDLFTQPSPGSLTDGIILLAALFHPALFDVPSHLQNKYLNIHQKTEAHAGT